MTTYSLTLREDDLARLRAHLLRPDGTEHAAYLLCTEAQIGLEPWDCEAHRKFLVYEMIPVPDDQVVESTPHLVTWRTTSFVAALKRAHAAGQTVAIVHNHPVGITAFSRQDDANEQDLAELAVKRNGPGTPILSVILTADGHLSGRIWLHPSSKGHTGLRMIRVIGNAIRLHYPGRGAGQPSAVFHRQALAFGKALNEDLAMLRVGIAGCGGTGSAVAMLLARLGIGQLVVIDNDVVDRTNLNRLHGARQADADAMTLKAIVVARAIAELGLGVRVLPFVGWASDPECRDALRACDVIFGCTDDHEGRLFLNRFAFYYLTPLIDVGLAIDVSKAEPPEIKCLDGRVTVVVPPHRCLLCRGVIDYRLAERESLRRSNPAEYESRKAEAYVFGEGDPRPAVVTFTTEVATMAVNELLHRLQSFRGQDGHAPHRVRKFHLAQDFRPGPGAQQPCRLCENHSTWAKGDVEPFLDRVD